MFLFANFLKFFRSTYMTILTTLQKTKRNNSIFKSTLKQKKIKKLAFEDLKNLVQQLANYWYNFISTFFVRYNN